MTKIIDFENQFDDLVTEIFTIDDLDDLKDYFEEITVLSLIKEALGIVEGG